MRSSPQAERATVISMAYVGWWQQSLACNPYGALAVAFRGLATNTAGASCESYRKPPKAVVSLGSTRVAQL
uniref:Uncharacterized protein n=1 Tax=Bradyrhizobium ottawaense TaxID=931866 RepID=A0A2U8P9I7_9BRAD|nr:hypothetical protein CIT37_19600 [Bradyrhizobium ottawaense]